MNIHVYFSVEREPGQPAILSVVCQDTEGRTVGEWAEEPTLQGLSLIMHYKLPYRLRTWLDLERPAGNAQGKEPNQNGQIIETG